MKLFGSVGAFFCFLAVLAGAVGSHALKDHLTARGRQSKQNQLAEIQLTRDIEPDGAHNG